MFSVEKYLQSQWDIFLHLMKLMFFGQAIQAIKPSSNLFKTFSRQNKKLLLADTKNVTYKFFPRPTVIYMNNKSENSLQLGEPL